MEKRPQQNNSDAHAGSLFDCPQPVSADQRGGLILDGLGSRKTLVGKGTLSMPIQRSTEDTDSVAAPFQQPLFPIDEPEAKENIVRLFDLLLRIDRRNHPELYD